MTFRHRAGVSPYTSSLEFAETCVFVKQSPPPFHCGPSRLRLYTVTANGRPFSRSYGARLPSSLARVLSSASGYSPCPRVSVCGTVATGSRLEVFLGSLGWMTSITRRITRFDPQLSVRIFLNTSTPTIKYRATCVTNSLIIYPSASLHRSNEPMAAREYEPAFHRLRLSAWS